MHQLNLLFVLGLSFYLVLADSEQRNFCDHSTREIDISEVEGAWNIQKIIGGLETNASESSCVEIGFLNVPNDGAVNMTMGSRLLGNELFRARPLGLTPTSTVGLYVLIANVYTRFVHLTEDGEIFMICLGENGTLDRHDLMVLSRHPMVYETTIQRALDEAFPGGVQAQETYTRHESCGLRQHLTENNPEQFNYCKPPTRAINVSEVEGDWILQKVIGLDHHHIYSEEIHMCMGLGVYNVPDQEGSVNISLKFRLMDENRTRSEDILMIPTGNVGEFTLEGRVFSRFLHLSEDGEIFVFCIFFNESDPHVQLMALSKHPIVKEDAPQKALEEVLPRGTRLPVLYTKREECGNI